MPQPSVGSQVDDHHFLRRSALLSPPPLPSLVHVNQSQLRATSIGFIHHPPCVV